MPRPPVTAVVATHDRPHLLAEAAASILRSLARDDELLIVESGDSHARAVAADLGGGVRAVPVARREKTVKLNAAARVARHEILLFTDDDCRVQPGWADAMAAPFDDPGVGAAFGPVTGLSRPPGSSEPVRLPPGPAPQELWAFAHGASMAVRRSALLDVGGFDERLGPGTRIAGGEEGDLVLRLRERGWACAVAAAPTVRNADWRAPGDHSVNVIGYRRGAGAYLGAGLRRAPARTAKQLALHLVFEVQVLREQGGRGVKPLAAFARGIGEGARLRPRRWL